MSVEGCNWFLRATVLKRTEKGVLQTNNFDYIEAGCDGQRTYTVSSLETQAQRNPNTANVAVGTIGDGIIPCDASMFIRDLWMGLASQCYQ